MVLSILYSSSYPSLKPQYLSFTGRPGRSPALRQELGQFSRSDAAQPASLAQPELDL